MKTIVKKPGNPGHGGRRANSGRPANAKKSGSLKPTGNGRSEQLSKSIAEEILSGKRVLKEMGDELPPEASPLDVMLMAMRTAYKLGGSLMAFPYAEKAAPYLHARLANVSLTPPNRNQGGLVFAWQGEQPQVIEGEIKRIEE